MLPDWRLTPSTLDHAAELSVHLRDQDLAELAALEQDPVQVLFDSVRGGPCNAIVSPAGQVACIMGAVGIDKQFALIWMLGSDHIRDSASRFFLRVARDQCDAFNRRWPVVGNLIHEKNTVSRRFLEWAGFDHEGDWMTPNGDKFLMFARYR